MGKDELAVGEGHRVGERAGSAAMIDPKHAMGDSRTRESGTCRVGLH
jgi:hypothetical protein